MDKMIIGENAGKIWQAMKNIEEISIPELAQLLNGKSIMRYLPPKATAGFATFCVSTPSLLP